MADLNTDPLESRTRANLSYVLIIGAMIFIGYILYRWGDQKEILTLIIGLRWFIDCGAIGCLFWCQPR